MIPFFSPLRLVTGVETRVRLAMTHMAPPPGCAQMLWEQLSDRTGDYGVDWNRIRPTPPSLFSGTPGAAVDFPFVVTRLMAPDGALSAAHVLSLFDSLSTIHAVAATGNTTSVSVEMHVIPIRRAGVGQRLILRCRLVHHNASTQLLEADIVDDDVDDSQRCANRLWPYFTATHRKAIPISRKKKMPQEIDRVKPTRRPRGFKRPLSPSPSVVEQLPPLPTADEERRFRRMCPIARQFVARMGATRIVSLPAPASSSSTDSVVYFPFVVGPHATNLFGTLHGGFAAALCTFAGLLVVAELHDIPTARVALCSVVVSFLQAAQVGTRLILQSYLRGYDPSTGTTVVECDVLRRDGPHAVCVTCTLAFRAAGATTPNSKL